MKTIDILEPVLTLAFVITCDPCQCTPVWTKVEAQMKPRTVPTSEFSMYAKSTLSPRPIQTKDVKLYIGIDASFSRESWNGAAQTHRTGKSIQ
jgi:hypothetical protein